MKNPANFLAAVAATVWTCGAWAAVATVDGTAYDDFAEAVAAALASGEPLVLEADAADDIELEGGDRLMLDEAAFSYNGEVKARNALSKMLASEVSGRVTTYRAAYDFTQAVMAAVADGYVYDGTAKEPTPTVTFDGATLEAGDATFAYSWEDNTSAGTGRVIATGRGDYDGAVTNTFAIATATVAVPDVAGATYNGAPQTADVSGWPATIQVVANDGGTPAGDYDVVAGLVDAANYTWDDGTTADKTLTFTIAKATATLVVTGVSAGDVGADQTVALAFTLEGLVAGVAYTLVFEANGDEIAAVLPDGLADALAAGTANGGYTVTWAPDADTWPTALAFAVRLGTADASVETVDATDAAVSRTVAVDTRARWTVAFDAESPDVEKNGMAEAQVFTNGVEEALVPCLYTRRGYAFANWTNEAGTVYADGASLEVAGDMALFAAWTPTAYAITYNLADEKGLPHVKFAAENPATYTVEEAFTLCNPTRMGYVFTGWSGTDIEGTSMSVTVADAVGDRSYTANWTVDESPLTITDIDDLNGNDDLPANSCVTLDLQSDLTEPLTVPGAVTSLVVRANGHAITGTAAVPPLVFDNDRIALSFEGSFHLKTPAASAAPLSLGAGGATLRLAGAARTLTATAALGAAGVAAGEGAVSVASIAPDGDGEWKVAFRVSLLDGQDFNAWLYRANLAARIKIRMAESLPLLIAGGPGVETVDATVSGVEITGDQAERLVTFRIPVPQTASRFFKVFVE